MIRKLKEFSKKPITWGTYGKLYIISTVIGLIYLIACFGYMFNPSFSEKMDDLGDRLTRRFKLKHE